MDVNVAVIGAGQAGLATSYHLTQLGVDHVVFEAGRVAETWRSRRWDSFCLVTPNWSVQLPGGEYSGPEPDGFMKKNELVDHFQAWADSFHAPLRETDRAHPRCLHLSVARYSQLLRCEAVRPQGKHVYYVR